MSCCQSCTQFCCPCLTTTKFKRSSKYAHIEYTPSKPSTSRKKKTAPVQKSNELDVGIARPEQIFEFPQGKSEITEHPEMFMERREQVVTQQPKFQTLMKRYHSVPTSALELPGEDYPDTYSRTATLPRTTSPSRSEIKAAQSQTLPHGTSSLPNLSSGPTGGRKKSKSSPLKRRSNSITDDFQWVPGLPVLEESTLDRDAQHPLLQFSLHYDVQRCTLTVHLHHGSHLPAKDRGGTSDPFVVLYMIPNKEEIFESRVQYQTLDPVFDQSFEFKKLLPDEIRRQTLVMRVYDHDKFSKNDSIGGIILPLEDTDLFGVVMRMKIDEDPMLFTEDSKGDLLLALSLDLRLSSLKGVVLKATNLKKQDVMGLADPYIKIRLYHNNKLIDKWKSTIKRNTLLPVFNESFQFDILGKSAEDLVVEVLMMDYDRFSKDDTVGHILLGSSIGGEAEMRHWRDMISSAPQVISQWHTIRKM